MQVQSLLSETAQQQMGEHREKQLRQKQGRDAHLERKCVCGCPPQRGVQYRGG